MTWPTCEDMGLDRWGEAWRAECEARYVARMGSDDRRREYLADVGTKRGEDARQALRRRAKELIDMATNEENEHA